MQASTPSTWRLHMQPFSHTSIICSFFFLHKANTHIEFWTLEFLHDYEVTHMNTCLYNQKKDVPCSEKAVWGLQPGGKLIFIFCGRKRHRQSQDSKNTIKAKQPAPSNSARWLQKYYPDYFNVDVISFVDFTIKVGESGDAYQTKQMFRLICSLFSSRSQLWYRV